jgi:hypothetical protein
MKLGTSPIPFGLRYRSPGVALRYLRANGFLLSFVASLVEGNLA